MPTSQTYGYFEKPYRLFFFLKKKRKKNSPMNLSSFKKRNYSNFVIKPAERSNLSFSFYFMNHLFQTFVPPNMWQWNILNLIDCINIWERPEAAKLQFQNILVLNLVKHENMKIVNTKSMLLSNTKNVLLLNTKNMFFQIR